MDWMFPNTLEFMSSVLAASVERQSGIAFKDMGSEDWLLGPGYWSDMIFMLYDLNFSVLNDLICYIAWLEFPLC